MVYSGYCPHKYIWRCLECVEAPKTLCKSPDRQGRGQGQGLGGGGLGTICPPAMGQLDDTTLNQTHTHICVILNPYMEMGVFHLINIFVGEGGGASVPVISTEGGVASVPVLTERKGGISALHQSHSRKHGLCSCQSQWRRCGHCVSTTQKTSCPIKLQLFLFTNAYFPSLPRHPPPPPPNTHTQVPIIFFETCHGYRVQNHLIFPFKKVQFLSLNIQGVFHVLLWTTYGFMRFANRHVAFLFTFKRPSFFRNWGLDLIQLRSY